jgi:nitrate/TMAO reductase-like tetraheme cytochrome c subunit
VLKKALAFLGIDTGEEGLFPVRLRRRFAGIICLAVVALFLGGGGFMWISTKSWFCNTCHIMEPYVKSWQESTHGQKGVECIQCHFPPGFQNAVKSKFQAASMLVSYLTGTYATRARAEVQDASCMRGGCHEQRLLEGKADFKGVHFDHKPHLTELRRGKRLRCQTCHSQIVQGLHITVTESVCFTCHFKDLKHGRVEEPVAGCTGCHDVPEQPVTLANDGEYVHADYPKVACYKCHFDSVQGDGRVPKQVCVDCHSEPDHLARYEDHEFMHENHVTRHKVECFHCHSEIRHGADPEPEPNGGLCSRCHTGDHGPTAQLYQGKGARGVEDIPSSMWAAKVQCIACHKILDGGQDGSDGKMVMHTYEAGESSCIDCHGDLVEGMLADWKSEGNESIQEAEAELKKAEEAAEAIQSEAHKKRAAQLLEDARHNLRLVRNGRPVHNLDYALEVLETITDAAETITGLTKGQEPQEK